MEILTNEEQSKSKLEQFELKSSEDEEQLNEEIWRECVGFSMYEVSTFGNVRNKKTGKIMRLQTTPYVIVGLQNDKNIHKSMRVHRLVATAFIENPENKPQVNHLDKNKGNNNVTNLEWCTAKENNIHKSKTLIQTNTNTNIKVWRLNKNTDEPLELFNSITEASVWLYENNHSKTIGGASAGIMATIKGVQLSSCGFKWSRFEQSNLENEEWRNVIIDEKTYEKYFISNLGRFKNYKGIIMENYKPHHSGYIKIYLNKKKYQLHRLVAFAFIENPNNKPVVNHIDGNKTNNAVSNLEWCSIEENAQHALVTGLKKPYTRKIGQYSLSGELLQQYDSTIDAKNKLKIWGICDALNKRKKTAGGFLWKYLD